MAGVRMNLRYAAVVVVVSIITTHEISKREGAADVTVYQKERIRISRSDLVAEMVDALNIENNQIQINYRQFSLLLF